MVDDGSNRRNKGKVKRKDNKKHPYKKGGRFRTLKLKKKEV